MNAAYVSPWMDEDLTIFRDAVVRFVESEMVPNEEQWRKQQHVGKDIWRKAGETGLLVHGHCVGVRRQRAAIFGMKRCSTRKPRGAASRGFGQGVHSICAHYLINHGTEEQKRRFLPRMASGH